MSTISSFAQLADSRLIAEVKTLAAAERRATSQLIAALAEFDDRRLYLGEGCTSLYVYCTQVLHLSEHAAYGRIEAARIVRRFPIVLDRLADETVTLTAIGLLGPVLSAENHERLLAAARHKSKREVEQLVAAMRPQADAAAIVRKLPSPRQPVEPAASLLAPCEPSAALPPQTMLAQATELEPRPVPRASRPHRPVMAPLGPDRYKIQFTAPRETYEKLERARALLRHAIPNGDPAAIFDRALDALLTTIERKRLAATNRPRTTRQSPSHSRRIPAAVRREVWRRDGARCAFVGAEGRCAERGFLELHHVVPFAEGGAASAENIELRCRAHNQYEAEQHFGPLFVRETRPSYSVHRVAAYRAARLLQTAQVLLRSNVRL